MRTWPEIECELLEAGWRFRWYEDDWFKGVRTMRIENRHRVKVVRSVTHEQLEYAFEPSLFWRDFGEIALGVGSAIEAGMAHVSRTQSYGRVVAYDEVADFTEEQFQAITKTARRHDWPQAWVGIVSIPDESPTDSECARRLAEQLSAGGTDGDLERETIRRRVEAELAMLERAHEDLKAVHCNGILGKRQLRPLFRMTAGDVEATAYSICPEDADRLAWTKGAKR